MLNQTKLAPVHPGEVLSEEFLQPFHLSVEQLATDLHVPLITIQQVVQRQHAVTAELALRLARYFGMSPQFWLGLQMDYDLDMVTDALSERLVREVKIYHTAA
jgi:antitoxin HigA-1